MFHFLENGDRCATGNTDIVGEGTSRKSACIQAALNLADAATIGGGLAKIGQATAGAITKRAATTALEDTVVVTADTAATEIEAATLEVSVANGAGGEAIQMSKVRPIGRGERVSELIDEGKRLTYETGNEHALVKLANGDRVIVAGGPGGIEFTQDVTRVFAHTHPYQLPITGPSSADFSMLTAYGQRSSWLLAPGSWSMVRSHGSGLVDGASYSWQDGLPSVRLDYRYRRPRCDSSVVHCKPS
jgi:hypothetical protein